jgi:hypothetical protein
VNREVPVCIVSCIFITGRISARVPKIVCWDIVTGPYDSL